MDLLLRMQETARITITLVWYPNESAEDYQAARDEVGKLIEKATGKKWSRS